MLHVFPLPSGTALAHVPERDHDPDLGIDGGIVKGGDRGTENALEGSKGSQDWPNILPAPPPPS